MNSGLLVEVWTKGMIWDRALGYQLIALDTIAYSTVETQGQWYQLDMELILMDGEVAGTRNPTGHMILLDCRFELPYGIYPKKHTHKHWPHHFSAAKHIIYRTTMKYSIIMHFAITQITQNTRKLITLRSQNNTSKNPFTRYLWAVKCLYCRSVSVSHYICLFYSP